MTVVPSPDLTATLRDGLQARLERLLMRPLLARVVTEAAPPVDGAPEALRALVEASQAATQSPARRAWRTNPDDGTCSVRIAIDYDDVWRGAEREVHDTVANTVEEMVTFLTDEQRALLVRSPREFLALEPRPEMAELMSFELERVGGASRVVELRVPEAPASRASIRHVAIVPNLVPIERQLLALRTLEAASDDGPLAPLRALVGLCDATSLRDAAPSNVDLPRGDERLDEHQRACVHHAMDTPHFAVIQGPPGSGKTTVIQAIVRRALERGERVLVVSPTHVAVDNVVEKLTPPEDDHDRLHLRTLPLRYSARPARLSQRALEYWVGRKKQHRAATISRRIARKLAASVPFAAALYTREDRDASGHAPLSAAVAAQVRVICGTPIGVLSYDGVRNTGPGDFDLVVVDEVSKMTLPEFLAVAVKGRRWVLVGDPQQLPPFLDAAEAGVTLDAVFDPRAELACSVAALLDRERPALRRALRLVVVTSQPARVASWIDVHLGAVLPLDRPRVLPFAAGVTAEVITCGPDELSLAVERLTQTRDRDLTHDPEQRGSVRVLVERGLRVPRPAIAGGTRLVEPRHRAQALIFEHAFALYHCLPWSARSRLNLRLDRHRDALVRALPSEALTLALRLADASTSPRSSVLLEVAARFALHAVSMYDWLVGLPSDCFEAPPLRGLDRVAQAALCDAVRPFVGTLVKQYRMHPSLSHVPRAMFYFGQALHDGASVADGQCRVHLVHVRHERDEGESNEREAKVIEGMLRSLSESEASRTERPAVMVITPYRRQEALLQLSLEDLRGRGEIEHVDVEVCTLDRCQGREAEYVIVSLVRDRATAFLDMPKRWNVALTRARKGMLLVGDLEAYRREARAGGKGVSLVARLIDAYDRQIDETLRRTG